MSRLGTPTTSPTAPRGASRKPLSEIRESSRAQADPEPMDGTVTLEETATGYFARATYLVHGLVGDGLSAYTSAIFAKGLPGQGHEFGGIPQLFVSNRRVVSIESFTSTAKVEISWGFPAVNPGGFNNPPDDFAVPQLETFTSLVTVATNKHQAGPTGVRGLAILVNWPTPLSNQQEGDVAPTQGASVQYMQPVSGLRFTRRERTRPDARARLFVGKLNSEPVSGDPAGMWMCTRLDGVTDDGGESYGVTYEFQRAPSDDGWFGFAFYTDPATGQLPEFRFVVGPPAPTDGITTVFLYDSEDFHALQLRIGQ